MRTFSPGQIPKDIPRWQYDAFRALAESVSQTAAGMSAIARGEAPDSSGSPLVDLSRYFYLPGRSGGQRAYGGSGSGEALTLSSTISSTKGKIYLGSSQSQAAFDESATALGLGTVSPSALLHLYLSAGTLARLEPGTIDVPSCTTTNGSAVVTCTGTPPSNFAPSGGPRIVPGMYITGPGIPAGTQVKHLSTGSSLTMTANAGAGAGTGSCTFQTYTDIGVVSDETGRDAQFKIYGGLRFQTGTDLTAPLRIVGDTDGLYTGGANVAKVYMEVGTISGGAAVGTNLQIGGPGHGDLNHLTIRASEIWINEPNSGSSTQFGIGFNPAEFGGGLGPDINFALEQTSNVGMSLYYAGGSATIFSILVGGLTGSAPNKALDQATSYIFKVTGDTRVYIGNAAGGGIYITGGSGNYQMWDKATDIVLFASLAGITLWSDSRVSYQYFLGGTTGTSAKRAVFTTTGNGVLDRIAFSSLYNLITNAQCGNAEFLAPSTAPEVLQVINSSSNGNDASTVLKVRTQRSGQSAGLTEWIGSTGATLAAIDGSGNYAGNTTFVSYEDELVIYEDETVFY